MRPPSFNILTSGNHPRCWSLVIHRYLLCTTRLRDSIIQIYSSLNFTFLKEYSSSVVVSIILRPNSTISERKICDKKSLVCLLNELPANTQLQYEITTFLHQLASRGRPFKSILPSLLYYIVKILELSDNWHARGSSTSYILTVSPRFQVVSPRFPVVSTRFPVVFTRFLGVSRFSNYAKFCLSKGWFFIFGSDIPITSQT